MPLRLSPLERRTVFYSVVYLLVVLGLTAQFRSYASPDTGFLLDEAAKVLDGARPYAELVEMNPPLTVLLNVGTVLIARTLGLSDILVYRLVCTAALLALLCLTGWLLWRIMPEDARLRRAVMLVLVFVLFVLAGHDYGEREHLLLALVTPYLLVATARAGGRPVPFGAAVAAGILAGGAFGLKPHFVLLWPAVELYLRLSRRVDRTAVLPETLALGGFLAAYAVAILLWAPDYPRLVRLLAGTYAGFLYVPFWQLLLRGPGALLTMLACLSALALGRTSRRPELPAILALAALACLAAGAAQQKGFSYHFYPASALSTLLLGVLVWGAGGAPRPWVHRVYRVVATSALVTVMVIATGRALVAAVVRVRDTEQQQMELLLPAIHERARGERVYVMSYNISSAFPLINYVGARSASRFPQLWILGAVYMDQLRARAPLRYRAPADMGAAELFLNQAVYEDLRDQAPKLLVVLKHARDAQQNGFRRLDYVAYFSRDARIAELLARYQQVIDVGDFVVYERVADPAVRSGPPPAVVPGTLDIVRPGRTGAVLADLPGRGILLPTLTFLLSLLGVALVDRCRTTHKITPKTASR